MSPHILIITGPTASGKTALSVRLAADLAAEIINADSVQVYRDFRIGSGMPTETERQTVPHHLFEILDGDAEWNAGTFRAHATRLIEEISERGKVPLFVGGTGLYLRAVLHGLVDVEVQQDAILALERMEADLVSQGKSAEEVQEQLFLQLKERDEATASGIHPHDSQRTHRALLLALSRNLSLRDLQKSHAVESVKFSATVICLAPKRSELYAKIDARVEAMVSAGFLGEVRTLLEKYDERIKPLQSIGYKQATEFVLERMSEEEFLQEMKKQTRRFAKRQETWWKHQPRKLGWIVNDAPLHEYDEILAVAKNGLLQARSFGPEAGRRIEFYWYDPTVAGDE